MDVVRNDHELASELVSILGRELKAVKKHNDDLKAELQVAQIVSYLLFHPFLFSFLIYLKGDIRRVMELEKQVAEQVRTVRCRVTLNKLTPY